MRQLPVIPSSARGVQMLALTNDTALEWVEAVLRHIAATAPLWES